MWLRHISHAKDYLSLLCKVHGLSISHEDEQGSFIIEEYSDKNMNWLLDAAKNYLRPSTEHTSPLNLYLLAMTVDSATALNLIRNAKSEEERSFYAYVADMNLQRNQKIAIENEKYD